MADTWKRLRALALRSNEIAASLEDQHGISIDDAAEAQSDIAREMSSIILSVREQSKVAHSNPVNDPRSVHYVPIEERRELMEHEVTLNNQKAVITGALNDYATVSQLPHGLHAEFAWWTVKHVIEHSKGEFNA